MGRSRAAIFVVAVLLSATAFTAWRAYDRREAAAEWVRHTRDVKLAIAAVRIDIADAQRGRAPWSVAVEDAHQACLLTIDNDAQQNRCVHLQRELDGASDIAFDDAAATAELLDMTAAENDLLTTRRTRLEHATTLSFAAFVVSLSLALFTTAALVVARERERRKFAEQSALLASVVESIGDAIVAASDDCHVIVANAGARKMFDGISAGTDLTRRKSASFDPRSPEGEPLARDAMALARSLRGESVDNLVISVQVPGESTRRWLNGSGRPVCDAAGRVIGGVSVYRDVTEHKKRADDTRALAVTDELTGANNRRGFFLLAEQHARLAARTRTPFTVLFADLDGLKDINDRFGHDRGDDAIRSAVALLRACLRESDIVARLGGDELVAVIANTDDSCMAEVTTRIQHAIARHNGSSDVLYRVAMSLGFATYDPSRPETLNELVAHADRRMYVAKRASRVITSGSGDKKMSVADRALGESRG